MDWTVLVGVASVIVTNLVTIITLYVHLDNKTENRLQKTNDLILEVRKSTEFLVSEIRKDVQNFNERWTQETKDFHGRLCAIEERNKK